LESKLENGISGNRTIDWLQSNCRKFSEVHTFAIHCHTIYHPDTQQFKIINTYYFIQLLGGLADQFWLRISHMIVDKIAHTAP
jgi:hypothetical protein